MRGSKPAEHRGGRKKSTLNKLIAECWAQYQAGGKMPLDYALRVTRANKGDDSRRDDMAKAAMDGLDAASWLTQAFPQAGELRDEGRSKSDCSVGSAFRGAKSGLAEALSPIPQRIFCWHDQSKTVPPH
jgi:hypothetical protein